MRYSQKEPVPRPFDPWDSPVAGLAVVFGLLLGVPAVLGYLARSGAGWWALGLIFGAVIAAQVVGGIHSKHRKARKRREH